MALTPQVEADFKAALKARDELKTSCLRMVRAAFKNREKELKRPLEEPEEIAILKTLAKQRRDAMEQFQKGGRDDLFQREKAELDIIDAYLPAQMSAAELAPVLDKVFAEVEPQGPQDMGKVMKAVMAELQGRADGKLVSQLVRERLSG